MANTLVDDDKLMGNYLSGVAILACDPWRPYA